VPVLVRWGSVLVAVTTTATLVGCGAADPDLGGSGALPRQTAAVAQESRAGSSAPGSSAPGSSAPGSSTPSTPSSPPPSPAASTENADETTSAPVASAVPGPSTPRRWRGWTVSAVADGDTLTVTRRSTTLTVRLIGVNSPETGECLATQAGGALRTLVQDGPLRLVRDVSSTDQYGRALRYVVNADGRDVGAVLVRRGLALARRYPPDTARSDRYARLEERARSAQVGLWAPDACGPATAVANISITVRADAAGDDNVNLNDEWVQFTNVGRRRVDMTGWGVADTSATHRYTFGPLVLGPGRTVTVFTGCGTDTRLTRYWCNTRSAVWNNDGDTVFLRDRSGNLIVSESY
jgi:micrococcal nuclease